MQRGYIAATSAMWTLRLRRWPAGPAFVASICYKTPGIDSIRSSIARETMQSTNCWRKDVDAVCVATPDDRHFDAARRVLQAGKHVLIEKPSVLRLQELDELDALARRQGVLAKVVYHKLADPDHKKLRTHVRRWRAASRQQWLLFAAGAEADQRPAVRRVDHGPQPRHLCRRPLHQADRLHLRSRAPGGAELARISATGQRGLVGPADGPTWDSVQLQMVYAYADGREAAFDIHTSWVTPDNFPGYVEQEVQFRFDNGVWNAHQRKRGVEVTVEGRTPRELKIHAEPSLQRHASRTVGRAEPARLWHRGACVILRGGGLRGVRRRAAAQRDERLEHMRRLGL